ncbi:MAG TPA: carbamoyltransferase HypF [Candidatus Nanopelagicales bacterium]|nr:carbamoyltransferase HypF [Candidatus Nanopelagicales bacterium]
MRVTGVVQGVGFRPYVYALATSLGLAGHVGNDDRGVFVDVEGPAAAVEDFLRRLPLEVPPLASVESVTSLDEEPTGATSFVVVGSRAAGGGEVALIPPDTAVCSDCLREVLDPADRRYRYAFTACTYCGPRYTIVTGLPYDRPFTTMAAFPLCARCQAEYDDPGDRRFHAQPTACPDCGPQLTFRRRGDAAPTSTGDHALAQAIQTIRAGGIVAVKGVGGYHLACDAFQPEAVAELRRRKQRGDKPFAVMVADLEVAADLGNVDGPVAAALASRESPIVLVPSTAHGAAEAALVEACAPGAATIGLLLPYSPLHHLVMARHPMLEGDGLRAVVLTSGNLSDEPLCIDEAEADARLADLADAFLHHDRPIHVSCDDSVVRVVGSALQPVRRSRGYAPMPVRLPLEVPPSLALGGELKAAVCIASGRRAWLSQHVGDVGNLETLTMLARTQATLASLVRVEPELVVADAHPAYLSRSWAARYAEERSIPLVLVQHHHAHLASLLAEHEVPPDEPVLGVVFDGTGYGDDATIWGGELLLGSYAGVDRVGHLRPVRLPGGDAAVRRPARTALAHLHEAGIAWDADLPPVAAAGPGELAAVGSMVRSGVGCTPTTSMGRLFDAVASLLDVRHDVDYEGQAAMELEALAGDRGGLSWRVPVRDRDGVLELDPRPVVTAATVAVRGGAPVRAAAAAFHDAVADSVVTAALAVRAAHGISTVGLTGGVFQNARLTTTCRSRLEAYGMRVLVHRLVPPNDGGLALGQVAAAAAGGSA